MNKMLIWLFLCFTKQSIIEIVKKINANNDNKSKLVTNGSQNSKQSYEENDDYKEIFKSHKSIVVILKKYDLVLKRTVLPESNQRQSIEGSKSVKMNHKNIMTTYLSFEQSHNMVEYLWIICERLSYDLDNGIDGIAEDEKINICIDLCNALLYLKQKKIVHLDVKLSNVGVTNKSGELNTEEKELIHEWYEQLNEETKGINSINLNLEITNYIENKKSQQIEKTQNHEKTCPAPISNPSKNPPSTSKTSKKIYKLFDFGLAMKYSQYEHQNRVSYRFYGTFPEIAPEIYNDLSYFYETDIFNFGVFCYQLHYEENWNNSEIEKDKIVSYSDLSNIKKNQTYIKQISEKHNPENCTIDDIIVKCLEINVGNRYKIRELLKDLNNIK
ncbi:hypothetical protein BDAP_002830 [Binucleata daphniae]